MYFFAKLFRRKAEVKRKKQQPEKKKSSKVLSQIIKSSGRQGEAEGDKT